MNRNLFFSCLCLLMGPLFCLPAHALPSDREQPIHISSSQAMRDESKGLTVYTGSVQVEQGSIRIFADKVEVHGPNNQVSHIIATGTPAHYEQQPSETKPLIVAKGDTITYLLQSEQLQLVNNASLTQSDGTSLSGNRIDYDIRRALVQANSNPDNGNSRIHMVIQPKRDAE